MPVSRDDVLHDVNQVVKAARSRDRIGQTQHPWVAASTWSDRDETLDRLRATFEHALARRGGVVLVAGEPGIGKTAVLTALAERSRRSVGRGDVGAVLGRLDRPRLLAVDTGAARARPSATVPAAGRLLSIPEQAAESDGMADRFELFDAVRTVLVDVSESRGLLVVLDDLQWADEASMALLSFLARHVQRTRVLIVGGIPRCRRSRRPSPG